MEDLVNQFFQRKKDWVSVLGEGGALVQGQDAAKG